VFDTALIITLFMKMILMIYGLIQISKQKRKKV